MSIIFKARWYELFTLGLVTSYGALLFFAPAEDVSWYKVYHWVYNIVLALLILDVLLRLSFDRPDSWRSEKGIWLCVDVVTTVIAFVPGYEAFRAARLLRIFTLWEEGRKTVNRLVVALAAASHELALMGVLIAVNALIGKEAFASTIPERFGSPGDALLASIGLALFDDFWSVYSVAFETHWAAAMFHLVISVVVVFFITPLIIAKVFKVHETE